MNKKMMLFASTSLLALSLPAMASADAPSWYVSGQGGISFLQDSHLKSTATDQNTQFNDGWVALGSVGYSFGDTSYGNGWRAELEGGYRTNDIDSITGSPSVSGEVRAWTLMVNALYDFKNTSAFTPYVGAGIGAAWLKMHDVGTVAGSRIDDSDTRFAAQAIAGVDYSIDKNWGLFANYHYLKAFDPSFRTNAGTNIDADYDNHTILVGLRYAFCAPKPMHKAEAPVAPAPAPQPVAPVVQAAPVAHPYLVFFDFDKSVLTAEAKQIIHTAVDNAKTNGGVMHFEVTGHTDRAGSDKYNLKLSQRRADAVKAELARLGVTKNEIVTYAKGESQPLVATDDGVREPQNRRAEIVMPAGK